MAYGTKVAEQVLLDQIEELRLKLYEVAVNKGLGDPETVNVSQILDQKLNQYNHFLFNYNL
ncbi:aspartyl-phosphate phosphatase Spo0E family protein [Robertmurraya sp.]|uniref:aspartyl-phosphate phosphatase Spo0E family protein n=1 Tax=Robertmurraya sp. TaxID=2837525 RepID=UPI0037043938